jgi:hypothetical protein
MKITCYLCGAESKLVDAKVISKEFEGLAVCDSNTGCHVGLKHKEPGDKNA